MGTMSLNLIKLKNANLKTSAEMSVRIFANK